MEVGTWRDGLRPVVRIVNKLLVFFLAGAGAIGGMFLANKLYPRDSTVETVGIVAGIAVGVLLWWPISRWLYQLVSPPVTIPLPGSSASN